MTTSRAIKSSTSLTVIKNKSDFSWSPMGAFDDGFLAMKFRKGRSAVLDDSQSVEQIDARTELLEATLEMEEHVLDLRYAQTLGAAYANRVRKRRGSARKLAAALARVYELVESIDDPWSGSELPPCLRFIEPLKMEDVKEKTAFHEAGHAVVGCFLGVEVASATIVPDIELGSLGAVSVRYFPRSPWPSQVAAQIIFLFAGHYAACRRFPHHLPNGWQDDHIKAKELIAEQVAEPRRRVTFERNLRQQSLWLVDQLWPAISDVAAQLLKRKTLRVHEIEQSFRCIPHDRRQSLLQHPRALRQAMASDATADAKLFSTTATNLEGSEERRAA